MRKTTKSPCEKFVKDIKRARRKHYSSEEKIRIVLDGLRGEDRIAELCRREVVYQGIYAQCFLSPRCAAFTCNNVVARD